MKETTSSAQNPTSAIAAPFQAASDGVSMSAANATPPQCVHGSSPCFRPNAYAAMLRVRRSRGPIIAARVLAAAQPRRATALGAIPVARRLV